MRDGVGKRVCGDEVVRDGIPGMSGGGEEIKIKVV